MIFIVVKVEHTANIARYARKSCGNIAVNKSQYFFAIRKQLFFKCQRFLELLKLSPDMNCYRYHRHS